MKEQNQLWDVPDRAPIYLPDPVDDSAQAYWDAIQSMPPTLLARYERSMATVEVLTSILRANRGRGR